MSAAVSAPLYAVVVPPAYSWENEKPGTAEDLKSKEAKLQKILTEMTSEQQRHQQKVEKIKKELGQMESGVKVKTNEKKAWVSPKVAMFLDEDSKGA